MQSPAVIAAFYLLVALAMTWPIAADMSHQIPQDLGDPLLNCWILGWDLDHITRFIGGETTAFRGFWDANIYHPEPLALAYSEHLLAQAVLALPCYLLTRDIVFCYNVMILATFVLSAWGAFLLAREFTGHTGAAIVAGLVFGFIPYRIDQLGHLQVLSSQWMPLALYALRRFFVTRSKWAWCGAVAALVMQNLSCGYYLFFFAPFVALFVLWEMATRGLLRDWRTWRALLLLGSLVVILTLPFVLPYAAVRLHGGILREVDEVEHYSADLMSYLTADRALRLWGKTIEVFVKPEGDLFPGFLVIAVSLAAIGLAAGRIRRTLAPAHDDKRRRLATLLLLACGLLCLVIALAVIISGVGRVTFMGMDLSARSPRRSAALALVFLIAAVVVSPRLRAFLRAAWRAPDVLMAVCAALACWLSLGPRLHAFGTAYDGLGIYWLPYALVPGWDGLRVPARYAMIAFLFAAMLVAFALSRISGRWRVVAPILLGGLFLAEATAAPVRINRALHDRGLRKVPTLVLPPPPIYERVRALPPDAVLAELPFGNPYHEVRYMFYSIGHWRRLLNGYSGGSPKSYELRASVLTRALSDPERAWLMLKEAGATHVIVHETDWHARKGQRVTEWLEAHGARRLAAFGGDVLLALPGE